MSENTEKDIVETPAVEAKPEIKVEPKVESAPSADSVVDYWANAWANRGV
jgi:hypothetical protein